MIFLIKTIAWNIATAKSTSVWAGSRYFIEVGQPVTRLPPHRSLRAELPHKAPQSCSLRTQHFFMPLCYPPQWGLHILSESACPVCVSFVDYTTLSTPSPCNRLSRLRVLWVNLTRHYSSVILLFVGQTYLHPEEFRFRLNSVSGFSLTCLNIRIPWPPVRKQWGLTSSCRFSPYMPRSKTPTVPRKSRHCDFSVLASVITKTSPTALIN